MPADELRPHSGSCPLPLCVLNGGSYPRNDSSSLSQTSLIVG